MGNTPSLMTTNLAYQQWLAESDDSIVFLDKAEGGKVTMDDVRGGLKEYERLFKAGLASPAELITLHRAYPNVPKYANVVDILDLNGEDEPTVIGGPASVELVDREGHLITSEALEEAFERYMDNFRTRNVMVMHSDVQVGHALPVYISRGGQIFKSGVEGDNLFFISELRDDTKISKKVKEQINSGKMRSYSIAGSATKTKNISKGADTYMQVDGLELAEITICEKGVNQGAHFELMKAEQPIPTESDTNLFVISKEDIPSFTEVFSTWFGKASKEGIVPELSGKQMAVLENGTARQIQHRALLDEMGFPMYVYPENLRHPVDYDEPGRPVPSKIVNQAGQDLGDPNVEEMVKSATDTFAGILKMNEATPVHKPNINPADMNDYTGDEDKDAATEKGIAGALASLAAGTGEVAGGIAEGIGHLGGGVARGAGHTARGAKEAIFGEEEEKMVKSATDAFVSILRKGRTQTRTTYEGRLPDYAVPSDVKHKVKSDPPTPVDKADDAWSRAAKIDQIRETKKPSLYRGTVTTETTSTPDVTSQTTGAVPTTAPHRSLKTNISSKMQKGVTSTAAMRGRDDSPPVARTRTDFDPKTKTVSREPISEKGIIGDVAGAAGSAAKAGVKGVGGALAGGAAGLTGSKQNIGWGGGEKSVDEDDEETSVKKSTDIFKRVLEAERPDETWTGTDKEKEVPMEKIVGALLAPVAGLVGGALSTAGGIAGGAAKKIIGG